MDATELFKHKQALRETIRVTVERRDFQQLKAISAAVNDLEQELLEAFWELDELSKGVKRSTVSRGGRAMLSIGEEFLRGYSLFMMGTGVSLAWKAARIRSRLKGESVRLEFDQKGRVPFPLDPE